MPTHESRQEFGYPAKRRRVTALRTLDSTGVISFEEYLHGATPQFLIRNADGQVRRPTGREVPVYLLGVSDLMIALRRAMPDVIDTAFANENVVDRETLAEAMLAELDSKYGAAIKEAAGTFCVYEDDQDTMVAAS